MKRAILACMVACTLCSGCMVFDDDFIEDEPDAYLAPSAGHPDPEQAP
jgi:hypothetical protein